MLHMQSLINRCLGPRKQSIVKFVIIALRNLIITVLGLGHVLGREITCILWFTFYWLLSIFHIAFLFAFLGLFIQLIKFKMGKLRDWFMRIWWFWVCFVWFVLFWLDLWWFYFSLMFFLFLRIKQQLNIWKRMRTRK